MAQNNISLAQARGNFLTWCITGYMPIAELCRPLFIAQMTDEGEATVGEFYIIYSVMEARQMFGAGSIAHLMAIQHFNTCPELPLYVAPVEDDAAGAAATFTITITGPATNSGVLAVSILDEVFNVGVIVGAAAADVASSLAAALTASTDLPFDVTVAAAVVTLTAKNKGQIGNWFTPVWNPLFGDHFPDGIAVTTAQGTQGAGVFKYQPAVPAMNCPWDCVALGTEEELPVQTFIQLVRLNWMCGVQGNFKGGHLFHSKTDTAGTIAAYGRDRNNPEEVVVPVRTGYKYPGYVMTAATCSRVCCTACSDPSRPVQYDNGFLGFLFDSRQCSTIWTQEEKRAFYDAGIMNWDVANARGLRNTQLWIEEPLTTYKYDPKTGAPDGAWQRVESRYTTTKFVRDLGNWYRHNYASVSLVNDGTRIPQGKRAVSPRILQASIIAWMRGTQFGWTAEPTSETLEKMVQVQRTNTFNNCDPNRVNVMIDLDLVNQLARIATSIDVAPEFSCIPPV